jgi:signal transduction histidine kinase
MRERVLPFGGTVEITGLRDKGTKARVSLPLGLK